MRVYVEHDMTVNHNTNVVTLKGGEVVEGPLAAYLVESGCDVTIEEDERSKPSRSSKAAKTAASPDA